MKAASLPPEKLEVLANLFVLHGKHIYQGKSPQNSSPLYAYLSGQVANDPELLGLLVDMDISTTVPNLFFSAVRFLLLR